MWQQLGLLKGKKNLQRRPDHRVVQEGRTAHTLPLWRPQESLDWPFVRMNFERYGCRKEEEPFRIRLVHKLATGKTLIASRKDDESQSDHTPALPSHF